MDIVVTAHLERNLSRYDWAFFYKKDVILLCALTQFDILNIEEYEKLFKDNKVVDFRICTYFLLPYERLSISDCELTNIEEQLLTRTICLNKVENIKELIDCIEKSSLSYTNFIKWGYDVELFKN